MLRLPEVDLHANAKTWLNTWTTQIEQLTSFDDQVATAKSRFSSRNKKGNKTFDRVKVALTEMCPGARRCVYCEDNEADEVEHMRPKDLYPEEAFAWSNYVYACGRCNGHKSNHFAVFDVNGTEIDLTPPRPALSPRVPPVPGVHLFIDPRAEDPFGLLVVDPETGIAVPEPTRTTTEKRRAKYTLEIVNLNRDTLLKARREAYGNYRARLIEYAEHKEHGTDQATLEALRSDLLDMAHPTVWAEMKRQRTMISNLMPLFERVPEALDW